MAKPNGRPHLLFLGIAMAAILVAGRLAFAQGSINPTPYPNTVCNPPVPTVGTPDCNHWNCNWFFDECLNYCCTYSYEPGECVSSEGTRCRLKWEVRDAKLCAKCECDIYDWPFGTCELDEYYYKGEVNIIGCENISD